MPLVLQNEINKHTKQQAPEAEGCAMGTGEAGDTGDTGLAGLPGPTVLRHDFTKINPKLGKISNN